MPRRKSTKQQEPQADNQAPFELDDIQNEAEATEPEKPYFTKEGYEPAEDEKGQVVVVTEKFTLTGNYDKKKYQTKHILDPQMWNLCRKSWGAQGMTYVEMLHCPTGTPEGFA